MVWDARARLAAGPRAPVCLTASPSADCLAVVSKCGLGRSGPPGGGPSRPGLSYCFAFCRLSGSGLQVRSGALGPAWRRALAPRLVLLLHLLASVWQWSRSVVWGARARLAAGPRAPVCLTASPSAVCLAVVSKCGLGRSGPPGGGPSRPGLTYCFTFCRLSGSALEMLSGALGPAWRRALIRLWLIHMGRCGKV